MKKNVNHIRVQLSIQLTKGIVWLMKIRMPKANCVNGIITINHQLLPKVANQIV